MSTTDAKKIKRKKGRKAGKVGIATVSTPVSNPPKQAQLEEAAALAEEHGIKELERWMDEEDGASTRNLAASGANGPLPYLGGEHCLLCRCAKPANDKDAAQGDGAEEEILMHLPLWVCADCKKTVEEEEKKGPVLEQDLRLDAPFFADVANGDTTVGSICSCEACQDRRQIQAELDKETQELQQCWMELRQVVRCVYREAGTGLSDSDDASQGTPNVTRMKELVHRLVTRDPHQLYQRLESQGREYVIEMKVRLLRQLTTGHKTPPQAKQFVSMLLEEYANLCAAAKTLASFLTELEQEHLKRFSLTWELHNKHLFQSIIYTDPLVQNSLTMLITQLRLGAASKESYHEDTYPNILHRYFKFDDEMSVISVVWRDCQQLLEEYSEEQAAMKAKQKMLKEDWEFFRAQRKILEQAVISDTKSPSSSPSPHSPSPHNFEAQFTETMRHILEGTKPPSDECHCPHCNRKRCPCDECTISHMITCGIINPEVVEQMPAHSAASFLHDPSRYHINVKPPSMSSSTSSSGPSSPITVEPGALSMPYHDGPEAFDFADDEDDIPEEIEAASRDSDDETSDDDNDSREDGDGEACASNEGMAVLPSLTNEGLASMSAFTDEDLQDVAPKRGTTEGCDCSHCAQKAKVEQMKLNENQCQCHACLMQSGQSVATSLPQHLPSAPSPASLHLYPHIHGSNTLNCHTGGLHSASAGLGSFIHPHLYELHTPLRSGKSSPHQKHQLNLDLESHEALQEHIYHAYGEWDNTYDSTKLVMNSHKYGGNLGSELFNTPPPPLLSSNPFISEALSAGYSSPVENIIKSLPVSSVATSATTAPQQHEQNTCHKNFKPINRTLLNHSNTGKVSTVSSTTITTTTNNVMVSAAQGMGVIMDVPLMMSDHCLKHNPFIASTSVTFNANNLNSTSVAGATNNTYPLKFTTEMLKSAAALKEEAARALGNLSTQPVGGTINLGTCSHANVVPIQATNQVTSRAGTTLANHSPLTNTSVVNTKSKPHPVQVSQQVHVSTAGGVAPLCTESECDAHDDDYNSIEDDSCSEQSSSTSTSAQKEGKYCDCCYCEVFGHSNPPVAPTSKNYQEMRDRLRLRLKKKNEAKTIPDVHHIEEINHVKATTKKLTVQKVPSPIPTTTNTSDGIKDLSIDQILQYIEGNEKNCRNEKKQISSKAAKRARQKQRKAEEKAKLEEKDKNHLQDSTETIDKVRKMEDVMTCQQDYLQHKKMSKQRQDGSSDEQLSAPQSVCTAATTGCLINRTTVLARHMVKDIRGRKTVLLPNTECKFGSTSHNEPSQQNKGSHNNSDRNSPTQQNGTFVNTKKKDEKRQKKNKLSEHSHTELYHDKVGQVADHVPRSQPQPMSPRNKSQSTEASSRRKGRNPKVDIAGHEVAESPPQVPAKQARQNKGGSSVNHNHISTNDSLASNKQQVIRLTNACLNSQHNKRDVLVSKSKSDTAVMSESTRSPDEHVVKNDQTPGSAKKKNKKKVKGSDDLTSVDEIFLPKPGLDLENGDLDESERELEEFKRFCLDSTPKRGAKLQVNMNLKDIFNKKSKPGISCA